MKKIIPMILILSGLILSLSLYSERISDIDEYTKTIIENNSLGYSDIPSDNGL